MKKFTIWHNSGGNHGHQLKDFFGGITIGKLFGLNYSHTPYPYLDFAMQHIGVPKMSKLEKIFKREVVHVIGPNWNGFPRHDGFLDFFSPALSNLNDNSLVILENAARVFPHQTIKWYDEGLIERDIFSEIINEATEKYRENSTLKPRKELSGKIKIAMHISRGVDYNKELYSIHFSSSKEPRYMFEMSYFKNIYYQIVDFFGSDNVLFDVYTEQLNSKEIVESFESLYNVNVKIGANRNLIKQVQVYEIFDDFINCDILVSCNSSFSTIAAYFRGDKPTIYHPHYHFMGLPSYPYLATDEEGRFNVDLLQYMAKRP